MKTPISPCQKKLYEKIAEEATVDCHDEDEQISGWECIFDEKITTPRNCTIGKQKAVLEKITRDDHFACIVGIVRLNKTKVRILLQDISLDDSEAMKYINAYRYWCKNGL